jgi:hypothetical protein
MFVVKLRPIFFFHFVFFFFFLCVAQITKLPTLDSDTATSPNIIQESEADTILKASEFVLGLSSYIGM